MVMKQPIFYVIYLTIFLSSLSTNLHAKPGNFVTTVPHSGRFGDQLVLYCRAKLIAHAFGLPLLHRPFAYSDQLRLYPVERRYTSGLVKKLRTTATNSVAYMAQETALAPSSTLFVTNYFTQLDGITDKHYQEVAIYLRKVIRPRNKISLVPLPKDAVTIAIHVRRGGGYLYDHLAQYIFKDKFMANGFYISSLREIMRIYPKQKLYAYLFTDDVNPPRIARELETGLGNPNITIDCRRGLNRHNKNVLEDFFSMIPFDCLIRPSSSYTRMVELLSDHKVVISPSGIRLQQSPSSKLQRMLSINPMLYKISAIPNSFSQVWRQKEVA